MTDVAWAPNSRQLLVMTIIGNQNAYDQAGLFLVDVLTNDSIRVLSDLELWIGEFGAGLAWSSDGANLAVYCPTLEFAQVCSIPVKIEAYKCRLNSRIGSDSVTDLSREYHRV